MMILRLAAPWISASLLSLLVLFTPLPQAAVVLQYHHVSEETPASTSTSPERFAMHLDYLEQAGFEVVPLQHLVDLLRAGKPLPDRTAAITFDDGYRSIYETAWPLLKAKGWPFTVFVNTEPHDRNQPLFMSWDQLREIRAGGATIGNHGIHHPYLLERRPDLDEAQWQAWVREEILGAHQRILAETGDAPKLFAYPYGEYNNAILEIVDALEYTGFGQQSGPLARFSDPRALPRFPFGGDYGDRQDFATKVSSLPMPLADGGDSIRLESSDGQPLDDHVLAAGEDRPVLVLRFEEGFDAGGINCFVSGQGRAATRQEGNRLYVQPPSPLSAGRSRYNCTAASGRPGRFYWYSQPWIVR